MRFFVRFSVLSVYVGVVVGVYFHQRAQVGINEHP